MVSVQQTEFWVEAEADLETTAVRMPDPEPVYLDETPALEDLFGRPLRTERIPATTSDRLCDEADDPVVGVEKTAELVVVEEDFDFSRLPARPRAFVGRATYADKPAPTFNMARFLTLTGALDSVDDEDRWMDLPRNSFHPRVMLDRVRRISRDFFKDLRTPPRNHSNRREQRSAGCLKL